MSRKLFLSESVVAFESLELEMVKYDIVSFFSKKALIEEVNDRLKKGWKLQGGVSVYDYHYCQAMTLEE